MSIIKDGRRSVLLMRGRCERCNQWRELVKLPDTRRYVCRHCYQLMPTRKVW